MLPLHTSFEGERAPVFNQYTTLTLTQLHWHLEYFTDFIFLFCSLNRNVAQISRPNNHMIPLTSAPSVSHCVLNLPALSPFDLWYLEMLGQFYAMSVWIFFVECASTYRWWISFSQWAMPSKWAPWSAFAFPVGAHEKSMPERTRTATSISRPPLESSRRGESRYFRSIFV